MVNSKSGTVVVGRSQPEIQGEVNYKKLKIKKFYENASDQILSKGGPGPRLPFCYATVTSYFTNSGFRWHILKWLYRIFFAYALATTLSHSELHIRSQLN